MFWRGPRVHLQLVGRTTRFIRCCSPLRGLEGLRRPDINPSFERQDHMDQRENTGSEFKAPNLYVYYTNKKICLYAAHNNTYRCVAHRPRAGCCQLRHYSTPEAGFSSEQRQASIQNSGVTAALLRQASVRTAMRLLNCWHALSSLPPIRPRKGCCIHPVLLQLGCSLAWLCAGCMTCVD